MSEITLPPTGARGRSLTARILTAGSIGGTLDIAYACVLWSGIFDRLTVLQVFQSVATGVLGRDAMRGGVGVAMLGLALHFGIATAWAAGYAVAATRFAWLRRLLGHRRGVATAGLLYGVVIYLAMNLVVVPLSRARSGPVFTWTALAGLAVHMVLIGLPIALVVGRPAARTAAPSLFAERLDRIHP